MVFHEHLCDVTNQRARFYFVGSIQSELLKLGQLAVAERDFYWFPDMPLGYHWSIHDANKRYPKGRIHMRLGKGEVRIYPGGQSLGNLIPMQEIPPFSQIRGVIAVGGPHIVWISVDAIMPQLKPFRKPKAMGSTTVNISFPAGNSISFGQHFMLVEPNNTAALEAWLSHEQGFLEQTMSWRKGEPRSFLKMEHIDIFKAPTCWLASVIAFRVQMS